jgi:hypothetical protein
VYLHPTQRRFVATGLALAFGLGLASVTAAQEREPTPPEPAAEESSEEAAPTASFAGLQIGIDPETGRMRPLTPEETRALRDEMREMFSRLGERRGVAAPGARSAAPALSPAAPVGMRSHVVGAEHLRFLTARRDSEGRLVTDCVHGIDAAVDSLTSEAEVDEGVER